MEYLELGDLQHYLSDGGKCPKHRLPEPEVHDISVQVLSALNAMHSVGFSHRDLKPAVSLLAFPCIGAILMSGLEYSHQKPTPTGVEGHAG